MKRLIIIIICLSLGLSAHSQSARDKLIPVSTNSQAALSLYNQGKKLFEDVVLDKALKTFRQALEKDPDFFMVNYQLAFFYFLNKQSDDFEEYAQVAIECKTKLSDAEELLRGALVRLRKGNMDLTDIGKKLIELYPGDPESYNNLASFQSLVQDYTGMVSTLEKAVKVTNHPAPFYNQLGYAYLSLKQTDKAEEAFDNYIRLEPVNPNAYDSKGDYFMFMKKYDQAYYSYMKANQMDSSFSKDKAEAARLMYEQTEGKKLGIVAI
jgi:tetratricopeptide (TPR) repeat protein